MNFEPNALLASLLVSTVGFSFFVYGKKQSRMPQLFVGLAMMVFPYFVTSAPLVLAIGAVLCGLVALAPRVGL